MKIVSMHLRCICISSSLAKQWEREWKGFLQCSYTVIPTNAHNPLDYKSVALWRGCSQVWIVFMVFRLNPAVWSHTTLQSCCQFGKLVHWQTEHHPTKNQYILYHPVKCLFKPWHSNPWWNGCLPPPPPRSSRDRRTNAQRGTCSCSLLKQVNTETKQ